MIPQTLNEYIERNYANEYDWIVMCQETRRGLAAFEILEGWLSDREDVGLERDLAEALCCAAFEIKRGYEIARYTMAGFAISPRLLAAAVANRADQWLRDDRNDCLRARGDARWHEMCGIFSRAKALAEERPNRPAETASRDGSS